MNMLNKFANALNWILGFVTNEHFIVTKGKNGSYKLTVHRHLFGFPVCEEEYQVKDLVNKWI